jgi:MHS family proline/betaine transporter-like MFS transporter
MGDTRGRGLCLLISVILMGVPTVIIGCLPTYAQAGVAAPTLLAIMRLIQGLAMGGEFGKYPEYMCSTCTSTQYHAGTNCAAT